MLALLGAVCACDAPPRDREPAPPAVQEQVAAAPLSKQQVDELSEQCANVSREQFRRAWKDGGENTADGKVTADFTNHYNANLNMCFYLLTVNRFAGTINKMLFDIHGGELVGEYLGPAAIEPLAAGIPKTCRVESLHCASEGEWQVLVRPYMED